MSDICSECRENTAQTHEFSCGHTMHLCDKCQDKIELMDCYSCRNTYISDVFPTTKAIDMITKDMNDVVNAGEGEFLFI